MAIKSNYPAILPSLSLDFANTKRLDPRITFTRTTTATYYDGKTVQKAEENLLLRSQEFENASWSKNASSVTANTGAAPDGTTTADTMVEDSTNALHFVTCGVTSGAGAHTLSVFAKPGSGTRFLTIGLSKDGSNYASATFNLSLGTNTDTEVVGTYSGVSAAISASANGFYRCSLTVITDSVAIVRIGLNNTDNPDFNNRGFGPTYTGDGTSSIIIWGAQLEQRSSVTAYTPTTTQPITNYIPALQTAAAGQARFDHNPTTGESLGLLIEEQRTNTGLQSEDFGTTWSATRTTLSTNSRVSPGGTLTADKIIASTDNNTHFVSQTFTGTAASWTFSVYAKAVEYSVIALRLYNGSTQVGLAYYNLSTGATGTVTAGTASITSVGNGWYRCILTATLAASASCTADIQIASADNTNSFAGNAWNGVSIWGSQIELGAFPTSYIPTTTASVTRNADAASMTGTNFSSWYRANEGTLYGDVASSNGSSFRAVTLSNSTEGNQIWLAGNMGSVYTSSAYQAQILWTFSQGKAIVAYRTNDFAACQNAATVGTDTSGTVGDLDRLTIGATRGGSAVINGTIRKLAYYPSRLTNTQIQNLTA